MPSTTPYSIYAGNGRPLSIQMLQYDNASAVDLRSVNLLSTPPGIEALFKRSQSDTDLGARISKALKVTTIAISGSPTGGTWTATVGGQVATIAYNAAASDVKAALEALSTVGGGNSIVQGGPGPGTAWVVCLLNSASGQAITTSGAGLTGGTSPAATPTTTGTITIADAINGRIVIPILPADTAGIQSQLTLEGEAKAFMADGYDITGWKANLVVQASDIQAP